MRRILSILLVMVFGLGPLSATLEASDDASLPVCCRRHGAHHCAMTAMLAGQQHESSPAFSAPSTCPYYPGAAAALTSPVHALAAAPALLPSLSAYAHERTVILAQIHSRPSRAHAGRGPPASI